MSICAVVLRYSQSLGALVEKSSRILESHIVDCRTTGLYNPPDFAFSVTMRLNYKLPKDSLYQERQRGFRHCAVPVLTQGVYEFLSKPSQHARSLTVQKPSSPPQKILDMFNSTHSTRRFPKRTCACCNELFVHHQASEQQGTNSD